MPGNRLDELLTHGGTLSGFELIRVIRIGETDPHNPNESKGGQIFLEEDADIADRIAKYLKVGTEHLLMITDKTPRSNGQTGAIFVHTGSGIVMTTKGGKEMLKEMILEKLSPDEREILRQK